MINNLEVCLNDLTVLFSKFLNVIYVEGDSIFKDFLNLKKNNNEDDKLVEKENIAGEEEKNLIYTEEELNKKNR